jgi:predicted MFS family arabinose efflux permease
VKRRASYALGVLFLINAINFFDRQIIGAVAEPIRREWALSDTELGVLATVFTLLYAVVGIPLGRLSDKAPRKWILSGGVFAWSLMTGFSGFARSFGQLVVARLGVGVGEATCSPAATSLLGDLYPTSKRARAMSVFMLGLPIGLGLSAGIGGLLAQTYGWRATFFVAGVPGILCAVAAFGIFEPQRGMLEEHAIGAKRRSGSPYLTVLSIPTMWWVIASGALHNFNMYAIGSFIAPLVMRYHKVDIAEAGSYSMTIYGFSGIPGLLFGGVLADRLTKRFPSGRMVLASVMFLIASPLTYMALTAAPGDKMGFAVPMSFGVAAMYVYYSTTYSTIQDLVEPSLRGIAMATYFCAMYLLGASLGPIAMGKLSDHFTLAAAQAAGVTDVSIAALEPFKGAGLHQAMYVIPILNVVLTGCMLIAARTVPRDIAKLQTWMRDSAGKTSPTPSSIPSPAGAKATT